MAVWSVYLLLCHGQRIYTGVSTDVARRVAQHERGTGAKFTRAHTPIALLGTTTCASRGEALRLEHRIKQLSPDAKRALALSWQSGLAPESPSDTPHKHAPPAP
ncbi:putative endonuclease [Paraperlucidibaca baekdonensis]|uniref:Putative endonuclease n=1 Tax=Paraperlucidibaca baekdonensis TaxID=748120 RepID=A0A3E0H4H8_9GAMM|nr:putative endonuclease [Paraperlucidibaca baekdonensis]